MVAGTHHVPAHAPRRPQARQISALCAHRSISMSIDIKAHYSTRRERSARRTVVRCQRSMPRTIVRRQRSVLRTMVRREMSALRTMVRRETGQHTFHSIIFTPHGRYMRLHKLHSWLHVTRRCCSTILKFVIISLIIAYHYT